MKNSRWTVLSAVSVAVLAVGSCLSQNTPYSPRNDRAYAPFSADQRAAVKRAIDCIFAVGAECAGGSDCWGVSALLSDLLQSGDICDLTAQPVGGKAGGGSGLKTTGDAEDPNGNSVFAEEVGNGISFSRKWWVVIGGTVSYGNTSSVRANDFLLAALLYGEVQHQTLRTRMNPQGGFKDDPPGTPDPKTKDENEKAFKKSELGAYTRAIAFLEWVLDCWSTELTNVERAKLSADVDQLKHERDKFK